MNGYDDLQQLLNDKLDRQARGVGIILPQDVLMSVRDDFNGVLRPFLSVWQDVKRFLPKRLRVNYVVSSEAVENWSKSCRWLLPVRVLLAAFNLISLAAKQRVDSHGR